MQFALYNTYIWKEFSLNNFECGFKDTTNMENLWDFVALLIFYQIRMFLNLNRTLEIIFGFWFGHPSPNSNTNSEQYFVVLNVIYLLVLCTEILLNVVFRLI
eukprot:TRINITY_DN31087_c0_g1_i9.p4 TRINITY_DN31087_c0_g1~~TRINITY_DN31087_c0_g1_i9.p4  ORF type:complete len:102 (-),score=0.28 TRINITY_DN31087_c0_g1_i9:311-616(-)